MALLGRRVECAAIDHVLAEARAGRSGTLVVRGEAGIGKTALLEQVRDTAASSGFRVEYATGVESETQFAFAGVHQVCAPLLDYASGLPDPQQAALNVAFGLHGGPAPDRFLVGLAVLNLLTEAGEEVPLLCLIDDAQWMDQASAQILAFVARRIAAERVALVFGLRDPTDRDVRPFDGLPDLRLNGLGETDARALLATAVGAPLDGEVRNRIVAEARGNPLALLELPQIGRTTDFAGGFELPDVLDVPRLIEDSFRRRSSSLPAETQVLLLVAAAEPTGDVELLWRAAEHVGIAREAAAPAEAAGLIEIGNLVRFRHPLVRSAVYQAAALPDQRRAHGALAAATDPHVDPDRRAWHRAQSVLGADEEVAAELEHTAGRARARGGLAAAAAFMEQAAMLTPDPDRRAARALEAAHAKQDAGMPEAAMALLTVAESGRLDDLKRARLKLLRAQIAFHLTRGGEVPGMLLDAARTLAPLDAALSRETYLQALDAAIIIGGRGLREIAEAARAAPDPPEPSRPEDLLLDGLVTAFTEGYEAGAPGLRRALETFRDTEPNAGAVLDGEPRRRLWQSMRTAVALFDDDLAYVLASRTVQRAREAGALATLPVALNSLSSVLVLIGELARAAELLAELDVITRATDAAPLLHARVMLAGWRGQQSETLELHAAMVKEATRRGRGTTVGMVQLSLAFLHNGLGNYDEALAAATLPGDEYQELAHSSAALPELIEAAVRSGQPERAAAALEQLSSRAGSSGTQWALGLEARSRALTSTGPDAEEHFREAIQRLGRCRAVGYLARTHLVYGEWLRREGRRQDAREQLRTAHEQLSNMGADAFAERAARELRATGEHPRKRNAQPSDALTAHEMHIARLVATGATNREVGAQLFLSPRTIEAHLRSIYGKLNITSRRQLRDLPLR